MEQRPSDMVIFIVESHRKICEKKDFSNIAMPSEDSKILELNQNKKSEKALFIIYPDLECLIEKTDECKNNPEIHAQQK